MNRADMLEQLNWHGEDAGTDLNDGLEPNGGKFGWTIEDGRLTAWVQMVADEGEGVDGDYGPVTKRTWQLVPVLEDDE